MHPILIDWHGLVLPTWHFCFLLAALVALWSLFKLQPNMCPSGSKRDIINLYIICYLSGYLGARALSIIIEDSCRGFANCAAQLFTLGSLTLYGGVIAAFICALLYVLPKKLPLRELLDCFVTAMLLAVCIGRIGCFFNGDDYGTVTDSALGVVFPNLGDGLARYPTQLFEATYCLLLCLWCYLGHESRTAKHGTGTTGLYGAGGYALLRFINEYWRGDYRGWVIEQHLSTSQFISVVVGIAVLLSLAFSARWRAGKGC